MKRLVGIILQQQGRKQKKWFRPIKKHFISAQFNLHTLEYVLWLTEAKILI
jgi:hypothetical protein